jgi:microcin C transport system substrate-binding protein
MRLSPAICGFALALLPLGCGVREGFDPIDCRPDYQRFLARFDQEYRLQFINGRLRRHFLAAVEDPAAGAQLAGELRAKVGEAGEALPPPLDAWLADPAVSGWTEDPALLPGARGRLREWLGTLAGDLAKPDADLAELREQAARLVDEVRQPRFFTNASEADLPAGLAWVTNLDAPEVGSPEAKKGGTFHNFIVAFPPSLRITGSESNNSFRSEHYDNVDVGTVEMHPDTGELIPGVADRWAVSPDNRTVWFHIDPGARFSDGSPVTSDDYQMTFFVQLNDYVNNPYGHTYYREQFTHFTRYSERIFAVELRQAKPLAPFMASLPASSREFYREIGPDFEKRYDWRCRPTTGAYHLRPEGIDKGRSLTLFRVADWWAKDRRYRRHRFNADRIHYTIIRDLPKAWEVFRNGDLDSFPLTIPEYWYQRSEVPEVFDGLIYRTAFYNVWPSQAIGLYLNCNKAPLDNRDVRVGLHYACDWQRVIDVILRGDALRAKAFHQGYVLIPDPPVKARPYDPAKAREHFARAGFTRQGSDGILRNERGEKLEVAITLVQVASRLAVVNLLAEQARKAGVDIRIDALEGTSAFQKMASKQHQIAYTGWGFTPPINDYHQFLHSSNAFEADGRPKANTNNLFTFADPRVDQLCERHRAATTLEELAGLSHELEKIMHEEGLFVPGATTNFVREAHWRWLRWPEQHAVAACYIPFESYCWWIDGEMKSETLAARAAGRKFPEVLAIMDAFRAGPPPAGEPEPAPPPPAPLPES